MIFRNIIDGSNPSRSAIEIVIFCQATLTASSPAVVRLNWRLTHRFAYARTRSQNIWCKVEIEYGNMTSSCHHTELGVMKGSHPQTLLKFENRIDVCRFDALDVLTAGLVC